jgi:hypothetical protein
MFDELFTVLFSIAEYDSGKSSRIWAAIPSGDSTWRRNSDLTKLVLRDATSFDVSPTTWGNLDDLMLSTLLTEL